jgi:transcriptional regulator with XRE-family HTH domain
MIERIREILKARQLTPTQFADAISIARPIVSHILSGRNKPSLEVVQKIIAAFPDLSLPWLLSGVGEMLASVALEPALPASRKAIEAPAASAVPAPPVVMPTKRLRPGLDKPVDQAQQRPVAAEPRPALNPELAAVPVAALAATTPAPHPSEPLSAPALLPAAPAVELPLAALGKPGKAIRRIVIFYQDGTFTDYQPE